MIPLSQNELQQLHDLSCSFTMSRQEYVELSELARRAVKMIVEQSMRIKQLKGVLDPAMQPSEPLIYRQLKDRKPNAKPFSILDFLGIKS